MRHVRVIRAAVIPVLVAGALAAGAGHGAASTVPPDGTAPGEDISPPADE